MASRSLPPPPPPPWLAKPQPPPEPTTILSLTDDLLRDIFLRLPSLPSLIRAALACRPFLAAIRSSPEFRRRFRALRPPPLLGFFDYDGPGDRLSFTPVRRGSDPDLAAAVRRTDAFLTRVPCPDDACPGWWIVDSCAGRLLIDNWKSKETGIYDPLTGALDLLPALPANIADGSRGKFIVMGFLLLPPIGDEAPHQSSFRVVFFFHDKSRVRVAVFSLFTKVWEVLPWSQPMPEQPASGKYWLRKGMLANNGLICWPHTKHPYIVVLDTSTWEFSSMDLVEDLKGRDHLYRIGCTRDGRLCMVATISFTLVVWFRKADDDDAHGVEKWVLSDVIPLDDVIVQATQGSLEDHGALRVLAIFDGVVYLCTCETLIDGNVPCWYLYFCLESGKLEKIFYTKTSGRVHPYSMAWPTSLV